MLCDFEKRDSHHQCRRCGKQAPPLPGVTSYHAECWATCAHFGAAVGTIKVPCGCAAGTRIALAAYRCAAYGRCLPHWTPPDAAAWREQPEAALYHVCAGCESFAANSS